MSSWCASAELALYLLSPEPIASAVCAMTCASNARSLQVNFFSDSPAAAEWRVLMAYLEELEAMVGPLPTQLGGMQLLYEVPAPKDVVPS